MFQRFHPRADKRCPQQSNPCPHKQRAPSTESRQSVGDLPTNTHSLQQSPFPLHPLETRSPRWPDSFANCAAIQAADQMESLHPIINSVLFINLKTSSLLLFSPRKKAHNKPPLHSAVKHTPARPRRSAALLPLPQAVPSRTDGSVGVRYQPPGNPNICYP